MSSEQLVWAGSRLNAGTVDALQAYAARAQWPAGFMIYQRGASADGIFIVLSGRVVLRSRVRGGRGFVPWIAGAGETFGSEGLSSAPRYITDARADEETVTLFLSGAQFRSLTREQPQHAIALVSHLQAERSALLEKLRELTTMSVEQRLIVALMRMTAFESFTRADGRIELTTPRYRLLCELVGATRESVSLVLARFSGDGIVERDGSATLVDPDQLAERLSGLPLADLLLDDQTALTRKAAVS